MATELPRLRALRDKLWRGLQFNDLQVVSTDHCPFCFKEQKEMGKDSFAKIPNGGPGVENRMSLVYNGGVAGGKISLNRFVEITSTSAAKIFGLFPRKGTIAVGSDADIVIFDPNEEMTISAKTHHMNVDYSCYEGMTIKGVTKTVLSRGEIIISMDGDLQHDPAEIPLFIEKMQEGYDIVSGWRVERTDHWLMRQLPSRVANRIMAKLSRVDLHDFGTTFKAYRREILSEIHLYGELHRFIPALASWAGASGAAEPWPAWTARSAARQP